MSCRIEVPAEGGLRILAIDPVEEGVTWFSRAGAKMMQMEFSVGPRSG